MGEQLFLFGEIQVQPDVPVQLAPEQEHVEAVSGPPVGQIDLFEDRWVRAAAANRSLEIFDIEVAAQAFQAAVQLYPFDKALCERAELVMRLAAMLRNACEHTRSHSHAMASMESEIPSFLKKAWHRRLATLLEEEFGPGAVIDSVPAGLHWFRAGELELAEKSLRYTLMREASDCITQVWLAEVLYAQGRSHQSREIYRDAFATSPERVVLESVTDTSVRELSELAEVEYELPGRPVSWAAAIGLIDGVFRLPVEFRDDWLAPENLERLPPGLQFYRWLVAEKRAQDDTTRVACRRRMRALSPRLMTEYLARKG